MYIKSNYLEPFFSVFHYLQQLYINVFEILFSVFQKKQHILNITAYEMIKKKLSALKNGELIYTYLVDISLYILSEQQQRFIFKLF